MGNYIHKNRDLLKRSHYLLLTNAEQYWFNASPGRLQDYRQQYGDDFCLVLYRYGPDNDCYIIPFKALKQLLISEYLVPVKTSQRWHGSIKEDILRIRTADHTVNVSQYYNAIQLLQ